MIVLVDGDIVVYRNACVYQDDDLSLAIWQSAKMIERIIDAQQAEDCKIFLTGKDNFRKKIYPDYKANRKDHVKPKHWQDLRDYLVDEFDAVIVDGIEADDALGINQTRSTCIASIDKDLLQVPGYHYNFVKNVNTFVDKRQGDINFFTQLLTGDVVDNCPGCKGIGKAKAGKVLAELETYDEMLDAVRNTYHKQGHDDEWLITMARCLWIQRKEGEVWEL